MAQINRTRLAALLERERADYEAWSAQLLEHQLGFVVHTTWEGQPVGRLALLHPDTSVEMIAEILASTA